jgi:hypothetical protein
VKLIETKASVPGAWCRLASEGSTSASPAHPPALLVAGVLSAVVGTVVPRFTRTGIARPARPVKRSVPDVEANASGASGRTPATRQTAAIQRRMLNGFLPYRR